MAKGVKAVKRVTKKELKEDKLVTTYFKARQYLEEHQKITLRIAGGTVLVIALAAFWFMSKSHAESQASYELSMAILASQSGDAAALTQQFSQIAERYSGTASGDAARFYIARMKFQEHKPEEALQAYDDFLRHASKAGYLYPAALAGKGAALEDLNRFGEAAQFYLKAAEFKKDFFAEAGFRLDAGRCFAASGDKDRARQQYQYVLGHYPKTVYFQKAQDGLARL